MSDNDQQAQAGLQAVYVKEQRFEGFIRPLVLPEAAVSIKLEQSLDVLRLVSEGAGVAPSSAPKREDGSHFYEITLRLVVYCKGESGEKPAEESDQQTGLVYRGTVMQAGVFLLEGFTKEGFERMVNTHCAQILYAYGCVALRHMVTQAGFTVPALPFWGFEGVGGEVKRKEPHLSLVE